MPAVGIRESRSEERTQCGHEYAPLFATRDAIGQPTLVLQPTVLTEIGISRRRLEQVESIRLTVSSECIASKKLPSTFGGLCRVGVISAPERMGQKGTVFDFLAFFGKKHAS